MVATTNKTPTLLAHREASLPRLAWCLARTGDPAAVELWHGSDVELGANGFVDGAWDGEFANLRPDEALVFTGSGGRLIDGGGLILATPTHTLEPLYSVRLAQRVLVSNSLVFLLSRAGLALDPGYRGYILDYKTVAHGLDALVARIPTRSGPPVRRHYHCNLLLDRGAGLQVLEKPPPPRFEDFESYRSWLAGSLARVFRNAADPARRVRYEPVATLSTGYDSPACAALARDAGCRESITIRDASWGPAADDSGARIAACLGLSVQEAGGRDYLGSPGLPEAEFLAPGDGSDVPFAAFAERLPGRLLVTGFHGDKVWDPGKGTVSTRIVRGDASGSNMGEFRLRVGFMHLPVPFMGCVNAADIQRISRSTRMDPWRIGGQYDRPIARRMAEEAGVARELFGRHKLATAIWWNAQPPKPESAESYRDYCEEFGSAQRRWIRLGHGVLYRCSRLWQGFAVLVQRVTRRLGRRLDLPQIVPRAYTEPADQDLLVQWAVTTLRGRYGVSVGDGGRCSSDMLTQSPGDSNRASS